MNIILPIITNLITIAIIIAGIFIGKRNGFGISLSKFILLVGACIGSYFLVPLITNLLIQIEFINELMILPYSAEILNSLVLLILTMIFYLIITLICKLITSHVKYEDENINIAKPAKIKGLSRKETKQLRKEQRKLRQLQLKEKSTASKIFGIIYSVIISIIICFVLYITCMYIIKSIIVIKPELAYLSNAYEYTIFGQLDKLTNLSGFII